MASFYLFSVIFNFLGGIILMYDEKQGKKEGASNSDGKTEKKEYTEKLLQLISLLNTPIVKLVIGLCSMITAIFKIFMPYNELHMGLFLIGDLFPILVGFSVGALLAFDYFKNTEVKSDVIKKVNNFTIAYKKYFGIAGIIAAVIHLFFAGAPVL